MVFQCGSYEKTGEGHIEIVVIVVVINLMIKKWSWCKRWTCVMGRDMISSIVLLSFTALATVRYQFFSQSCLAEAGLMA
ncbi:hypothetical protein HDV57DRAFT_492446 [Trichoderma longibrachiatum]